MNYGAGGGIVCINVGGEPVEGNAGDVDGGEYIYIYIYIVLVIVLLFIYFQIVITFIIIVLYDADKHMMFCNK